MKQQDNSVEKSKKKKTRRDIPKSKKLIAVAVVLDVSILVGLIVYALNTHSQNVQLKNQLSYISDTTNIILTDVINLKSDIESTLKEEASLIEDWKIKVSDVDFEKNIYTVDIVVIPKEYKDSTKTVIYFGTKEYELKLVGYQYTGKANLPLSESYDGNVTVLFTNGKKKNTEVLSSYEGIQPKFEAVLKGSLGKQPEYEDGKVIVKTDLNYEISDSNKYGFTSLYYNVKIDDKLVDKKDLRKAIINDRDSKDNSGIKITGASSEKSNNKKVAGSGNKNYEKDSERSTQESETEKSSEIAPLYTVLGEMDLNEKYDIEEKEKVRIYISGVTEEGYRFEYDLFNAQVQDGTEEEPAKDFEESYAYFEPNPYVYDNKGGKLKLNVE